MMLFGKRVIDLLKEERRDFKLYQEASCRCRIVNVRGKPRSDFDFRFSGIKLSSPPNCVRKN